MRMLGMKVTGKSPRRSGKELDGGQVQRERGSGAGKSGVGAAENRRAGRRGSREAWSPPRPTRLQARQTGKDKLSDPHT